jgi:transcription elongation factor GreA
MGARTALVGSPADNDEVLTVFEEIAVDESRITQLEDLARSAVVIVDDPAHDGAAGPGCTVAVRVDGRTRTYRLVGRRSAGADPHDVSLASPVGAALTGARAGDTVEVPLPNGRTRVLEVLAVRAATPLA